MTDVNLTQHVKPEIEEYTGRLKDPAAADTLSFQFDADFTIDDVIVLRSGSIDTGDFFPKPMRLSEYINMYLTTGRSLHQRYINLRHVRRQQEFAMCPPNFYLQGIDFTQGAFRYSDQPDLSGTFVESAWMMSCFDPVTKQKVFRTPGGRLGFGSFPRRKYQKVKAECPNGYAIDGIDTISSQYVESMRFSCKKMTSKLKVLPQSSRQAAGLGFDFPGTDRKQELKRLRYGGKFNNGIDWSFTDEPIPLICEPT